MIKILILHIRVKTKKKFDGTYLKQDKITFTHGNIVNIYIVYEIDLWDCGYDHYPVLENSLFTVKLIKNADIDKYKYSLNFGIEFYGRGTFLVRGQFGRNIIIFGVDMTYSAHFDNKGSEILILGEGPT